MWKGCFIQPLIQWENLSGAQSAKKVVYGHKGKGHGGVRTCNRVGGVAVGKGCWASLTFAQNGPPARHKEEHPSLCVCWECWWEETTNRNKIQTIWDQKLVLSEAVLTEVCPGMRRALGLQGIPPTFADDVQCGVSASQKGLGRGKKHLCDALQQHSHKNTKTRKDGSHVVNKNGWLRAPVKGPEIVVRKTIQG